MKCNQTVYCDIDDTLVFWQMPEDYNPDKMVTIFCNGQVHNFAINWPQVDQLMRHHMRGHTIIVWSQGGSDWAEAVVAALGLQDIVSETLEKPRVLYDDLPAEAFMPKSKLIK